MVLVVANGVNDCEYAATLVAMAVTPIRNNHSMQHFQKNTLESIDFWSYQGLC